MQTGMPASSKMSNERSELQTFLESPVLGFRSEAGFWKAEPTFCVGTKSRSDIMIESCLVGTESSIRQTLASLVCRIGTGRRPDSILIESGSPTREKAVSYWPLAKSQPLTLDCSASCLLSQGGICVSIQTEWHLVPVVCRSGGPQAKDLRAHFKQD
jgi:hypothetical protein